jgi:hypothetical protein
MSITFLVGKRGRGRPLGRPRRRWEGNYKVRPNDYSVCVVDWTDMIQDRDQCWAVAGVVMNFWLP